MRLFRTAVFLGLLAVIVAVGVGIWRGVGPLPDPEGCTADVDGHSVSVDLGQGQVASLIAAIGVRRGLPARAVSIALATAFQESKLRNLTSGDRDSVGIFQQRPSQGWGRVAQIRDPVYATNAFFDALQKVDGYQTMRITEAAQRVQRSGYPEAYEAHAADARALASALTGYSAGGRFTCVVHDINRRGRASAVMSSLRTGYGDLRVTQGPRQDVVVSLPAGPAGTRLGWSVAAYVVARARTLGIHEVRFHDHRWQVGRPSEKGWTRLSGNAHQVLISLG
ncbi:MAG: hypothetical protein ACTHNS_09695 [Marmoricola sp.]